MPTFNPNEPQNGETVDANVLRDQFNSLNDKIPVIGTIAGLIKADGAGNIAAGIPDTDYLTPTGNGAGLSGVLTTLTGHNVSELSNDLNYLACDANHVLGYVSDTGLSIVDLCISPRAGYLAEATHLTACDSAGKYGFYVANVDGALLRVFKNFQATTTIQITDGGGNWVDLSPAMWATIGGVQSDVLVSGFTNDAGYYVGDGSAFATAAQGTTADTALQPNATADGTYPVANDCVTSGQLAGLTITNGLITGVTLVP